MCGESGIQLKNSVFKITDEFRQFKTKIFFRTVLLAVLAVGGIYLLYSLFLKGNFAEWIVAVYQERFGLDFEAARTLYTWTFRNYLEWVFVIGVILIFFAAFRIYLNWFTRYFMEINKGIDNLISESSGEVSLPPELWN